MDALILAGGVVLGLLAAGAPAAMLYSQMDATIEHLQALLTQRDDRVAALEHQIDGLHRQGLVAPQPTPAEVELPEEDPLPPELEAIISGFDGVDDQQELREAARYMLRTVPGTTPQQVIGTLLEDRPVPFESAMS